MCSFPCRNAPATPAPATQVDLTDDATVAMLEQQMEMQMVAAAVAADEATARVRAKAATPADTNVNLLISLQHDFATSRHDLHERPVIGCTLPVMHCRGLSVVAHTDVMPARSWI